MTKNMKCLLFGSKVFGRFTFARISSALFSAEDIRDGVLRGDDSLFTFHPLYYCNTMSRRNSGRRDQSNKHLMLADTSSVNLEHH